jgi:predicted ribosome-associated RNA-binding protein Tma20
MTVANTNCSLHNSYRDYTVKISHRSTEYQIRMFSERFSYLKKTSILLFKMSQKMLNTIRIIINCKKRFEKIKDIAEYIYFHFVYVKTQRFLKSPFCLV